MVKTRSLLKKTLKKRAEERFNKEDHTGSRFEVLSDEDAEILKLKNQLADQQHQNSTLQDKMEKLNSTVEKLQGMLETKILRESVVKAETIPEVPLQENSFLSGAAQVIQDSTQVEKSSPFLDSVSSESWLNFDVKFLIYRAKKGRKLLRDMIKQEVVTYYQAQIMENVRIIPCEELYQRLKKINQPFLDPMAILRTNLSMDHSTEYDSDKTKNYLSSFLNLLERNPIIEQTLSGASIAKMFFSKLQPKELSDYMLDLQVQSKMEATSTLLTKIRTRDIAMAEMPKKSTSVQQQSNKQNKQKNVCDNCKHSTDSSIKSNHKTWFCKKISEFCYKCNKKHMAFGPSCPNKDKSIFDYERYLEKYNKDGSTKSDNKK